MSDDQDYRKDNERLRARVLELEGERDAASDNYALSIGLRSGLEAEVARLAKELKIVRDGGNQLGSLAKMANDEMLKMREERDGLVKERQDALDGWRESSDKLEGIKKNLEEGENILRQERDRLAKDLREMTKSAGYRLAAYKRCEEQLGLARVEAKAPAKALDDAREFDREGMRLIGEAALMAGQSEELERRVEVAEQEAKRLSIGREDADVRLKEAGRMREATEKRLTEAKRALMWALSQLRPAPEDTREMREWFKREEAKARAVLVRRE